MRRVFGREHLMLSRYRQPPRPPAVLLPFLCVWAVKYICVRQDSDSHYSWLFLGFMLRKRLPCWTEGVSWMLLVTLDLYGTSASAFWGKFIKITHPCKYLPRGLLVLSNSVSQDEEINPCSFHFLRRLQSIQLEGFQLSITGIGNWPHAGMAGRAWQSPLSASLVPSPE